VSPGRRTVARETEDEPMRVFVVERYLPALTPGEVRAQARREQEGPGLRHDVRHVRTTYLCDDELCFSVFEAPSIEAVREANERSAMPYERITEAVDVPADEGDEAIPFE
jgi:hypothetical protein